MKKININNNRIKTNNIVILFIFFIFLIFISRLAYLCVIDYKVGDITISEFTNKRNVKEETIMPKRGTIYDSNGNILAEDVTSYKLIAYLDESRSKNSKTQRHVTDKELTAKGLSTVLDMKYEEILSILKKDAYQVEFGTKGKNLTQIQKEEIDKLNLPGLDFEQSTKRYYPNGVFSSYLLGYTKEENDENNNTWKKGEMGIESYYDEELKGKVGTVTYERDRYGYIIANGREYRKEEIDGNNIYLTIDSNIQLFAENALSKAAEESQSKVGLMVIADAKTGKILAYTSSPAFNPNIRNIDSYIDPVIGYSYEPGSVMKIFSYMCSIDNGIYNGDATYESGSMTYKGTDGTEATIRDWNRVGWGRITYDRGFAQSSNIAVANLVKNGLSSKILKECYDKYGFGEKTNITLNGESKGTVKFKYEVEVATAGYGQGIKVTAMQLIEALTSITNNGNMLKPYIVDKIIDSKTNEVSYKGQKQVVNKIAEETTIEKIKELMSMVMCNDSQMCTGSSYYMDGYDIIAKTGTAQIWDEKKNKYMTGSSDYIYSFAGIYPKEDPEIIIYMALQQPKDTTNYVAPAIKEVITNVTKYLNLDSEPNQKTTFEVTSYLNKNIGTIKNLLEKNNINVITLGDTGKIVSQYPSTNKTIYNGDTVILLSNTYNNTMIDLTNMSYKEALSILNLMNINYQVEGTGYVYEQSISPNTIFTSSDIITIKLKEKYKE